MNFKEMCAQKRTEKDFAIDASLPAWRWLDETLNVLQEIPRLNLVGDGLKGINILRDSDIVCTVRIEIARPRAPSCLFSRWMAPGSSSYYVKASRHDVDESSSFHQLEEGVKGHKELRKAIQFWLAQMVIDNNWDLEGL